MAVKFHRCGNLWIKVDGHPCWRVQKALDAAGVEYEIVKEPTMRGQADERDGADAPEQAARDRARGRDVVPRGVEGDGAANQQRRAEPGAAVRGVAMGGVGLETRDLLRVTPGRGLTWPGFA